MTPEKTESAAQGQNATLGAVEQNRPEQRGNVASLATQLDHREQDPLLKASDSGLAERGQTPEYSMERQSEDELRKDIRSDAEMEEASPEGVMNDQDPGMSQKQNQNEAEEDSLAA